jgi:ubiquinone/menaquinone biosynthesis C-methylase UbiE
MGETRKTKQRWIRDGLYDKYIKGKTGVDIGVGRFDTQDGADTINPDFFQHDKNDCDATTLEIFPDNSQDVVWSSHCLEHLDDPLTAIANMIRICKSRGIVAIFVI